ncbi:MAG: DUF4914 family protein [Spirochaetes bacterium]|nr:DUF4914 family protein [Spirochaetota bacterium]
MKSIITCLRVPEYVINLLNSTNVTVANTIEDLFDLSLKFGNNGVQKVIYEVPGRGEYCEAIVNKVKNGISVNYTEAYMRRRDPDSMVIGDDFPTDKVTYKQRFGKEFNEVKKETFEWLQKQKLAVFFFKAGQLDNYHGMAIAPANAGFFCLGLGILQGIIDTRNIEGNIEIKCILYIAPVFRHTHFNGKQIVVHCRSKNLHEIYSYNLYPGPSAKKGVYSALLDFGEREGWVTNHCAVVQVITPYGNKVTIMHEGASGSGKSETNENIHRDRDGTIQFAENILTGESFRLVLPRGCSLRPVVDDMGLCHPSFQKNDGYIYIKDAESGWFIRVNHIEQYGTDPDIESLSIHPKVPLMFLNIDAQPHSTALLWEHIEDEPGKPCPNPRFIVPRSIMPHIVKGVVQIHIRSFGVRTPPSTKESPNYGILGLFHILPPALAWLWRLVSPRGHDNPSIVMTEGIQSEGIGSFGPFLTGKKVNFANLLLNQIVESPKVRYVLVPNQYIGAWKVGFNPQWIMREYLARRGGVKFFADEISESRCPLLGFSLNKLVVEGMEIEKFLLKPELQNEVGEEAYDKGAQILVDFFKKELMGYYKDPSLLPLGKKIIECCLSDGSVNDYMQLVKDEGFIVED